MSDDPERRAQAAQRLLNDPMLVEAFDKLEAEAIASWKNSLMTAEREKLWHHVDAIATLKSHLRTIVSDGKVAKANKSKT